MIKVSKTVYRKELKKGEDILPCWSVGRLIEIFNECSNWNTVSMTSVTHETYIEQLIELYEKLIGSINFSKL